MDYALDAIDDRVITLDTGKQDKLTAGANITITNNTISATGVTSYNDLDNKPQVNGVTLSGNKTLEDLGAAAAADVTQLNDDIVDLTTEVVGKNKVKESTLGTYHWDMTLKVYLEVGKTYTLYKLADDGKAINLGTNIILKKEDNTTVETIKNNYNGYYGYTFTTSISTNGFYILYLGFTREQQVGFENRFMLVAESVAIDNQTTYVYEAWKIDKVSKKSLYANNSDVSNISNLSNMVKSRYYGKIHLSYGDSITEQAVWQNMFKTYLGTSSEIIKGYSGQALWNHCKLSKLTTVLGSETFDFATVMFGTNDWGQSRQIGVNTDFNDDGEYTGTYKGSLNTFCKNITTLFPSKHIIMVTPPNAFEDYDYNNQPFSDNGRKNLLGFSIKDYADAMKEICALWGVPCFDFNSLCGWNYINKATYLTDDGNGIFVHPNTVGGNEYAYKLARFCENN